MGVYRLSLRFLMERPGRTLVTMAATAIGVAVLAATAIMGAGKEYVREWQPESYGPGNLTIYSDGGTGPGEINRLSKQPGIVAVTAEHHLFIHSLTEEISMMGPSALGGFQALGMNLKTSFVRNGYPLLMGRYPKRAREFVLSARLAEARGIKTGDSMRLPLPDRWGVFTVTGLLDDMEVGDIRSPRLALFDWTAVAREFKEARIDTIHLQTAPGFKGKAKVSIARVLGPTVVVRTKPKGPVIRKVGGGNERFITGAAVLVVAGLLIYNAFLISINQRRRQLGILQATGAGGRKLRRLIIGEGLVLGSIASALGAVAGIGIAWLMIKAQAPIRGEIAVFTVPAWALLFSAASGVAMTLAALWPAARRASKSAPIDAVFPERNMSVGWLERKGPLVGAPLAILGLAGVFYFSLTGDVTPIGVPAGMMGIVLFLLGLVFCSAKLAPFLVGLAARATQIFFSGLGRLAVFSAAKNPTRTGITVSTFFIATTVMLGFFTLMNSMANGMAQTEAARQGELMAVANKIGKQTIAGEPGIADFTDVGSAALRFKAYDIKRLSLYAQQPPLVKAGVLPPEIRLEAVEPEKYLKLMPVRLVSGRSLTMKDFDGRTVYFPRAMAREFGLKAGEELELLEVALPAESWGMRREEYKVYRAGFEKAKKRGPIVQLRVGGILEDRIEISSFALTDKQAVDVFAKPGEAGQILIKTKPGVDQETLARRLEAKAGNLPETRFITRERIIAKSSIRDPLIYSISSFIGLVMLLGIMSTANTQSANIIERQREFGLLKAVGLTNSKLRRMIIIESTVLGLMGSFPGLIAAIALSLIFVIGFRGQGGPTVLIPYAFPYLAALLMVTATAAAGLIAGLMVAGKVTDASIIDALNYE